MDQLWISYEDDCEFPRNMQRRCAVWQPQPITIRGARLAMMAHDITFSGRGREFISILPHFKPCCATAGRLTWVALAELLRGCAHLAVHDALVLLLLGVGLQALPWQASPYEVHQHVPVTQVNRDCTMGNIDRHGKVAANNMKERWDEGTWCL